MKKLLSIVLACAMLVTVFSGFAMTASAEAVKVEFTASSVTAKAGDIITVDISVSENHYMVNGQIAIAYDPEVLEIQEVWDDEDNPYFEDINTKIFKSSYMWAFAVPEAGLAKFAFATSSSKGTTAGGVMFTLTFKVLEDAKTTEIDVYIPDNDMNANSDGGEDVAVEATYVKGIVTIESDEPDVMLGDVTGDGTVDLSDATALFFHVNGLSTLTGDKLAAADMNADGEVSLSDATALFYQINGLL